MGLNLSSHKNSVHVDKKRGRKRVPFFKVHLIYNYIPHFSMKREMET